VRKADGLDILFVAMPFGPVFRPSIGVSLLQGALRRTGISSRIDYFSIRFSEIVGTTLYNALSTPSGLPTIELAGEWIFSNALFDRRKDATGYVESVLVGRSAWSNPAGAPKIRKALIDKIVRAQRRVPAFLDWCADQVAASRPRVVGLTSSFQQHTASLALARQLKERLPNIPILMGGANCEGVMGAETVRQFPFVDAVVSGEGDLIIVDLVRRLLEGGAIDDVPGVHTRSTSRRAFAFSQFPNAPVVRDMGALPYPDYRDYMKQFRTSRHRGAWRAELLFESSRGCWWGEKAHCTFCGLNGATMTYRSKSADRALEELEDLADKYPGFHVQVVDNIIEMGYFKDLLPRIAERGLKLDLFYETKSNLKKEQIRTLAKAHITTIQPGIESLSDPVLTLMRKGVTWLQNVQLLKWCKELGVTPVWNLLWGFPGEPPAEYERTAQLVPLLTHLPAPYGAYGLRLDRFSPNFNDSERLGFTRVRPVDSYRHIYSGLSDEAIRNLAYYFQFDYNDARNVADYIGPTLRAVSRWRREHARSTLFSVVRDKRLVICDLRPIAKTAVTVLHDLDRTLYEACDGIAHIRGLASIAGADGTDSTEAAVAARLQPLVDRGLLLNDGPRYLALAVPTGEYRPPAAAMNRFRRMTRTLDLCECKAS
jgi:ribosomal peptide maturation radical SAM protein 1